MKGQNIAILSGQSKHVFLAAQISQLEGITGDGHGFILCLAGIWRVDEHTEGLQRGSRRQREAKTSAYVFNAILTGSLIMRHFFRNFRVARSRMGLWW